MKNKKLTYVLGALVVVVWGAILYRVFSAVTEDKHNNFAPVRVGENTVFNDFSVKPDTTRLLLNYDDPFRLVASHKPLDTLVKQIKINRPAVSPASPKPVFNWDFVKYSGYVSNASSKKLTAVLAINGRSVMLQEGESADGVKLVKNYQDSVRVAFKGRSGYIRMQ